MAKGKNLNPADAHRKALRKKELKKAIEQGGKNQGPRLCPSQERHPRKVFSFLVNTPIYPFSDLEGEIEKLELNTELSASDKSRLTALKNELEKIMQKKDEYVKEHPEQRKLVYRARKQEKAEDQQETPPVEQKRNLFNKHGLPRHPERSIYYDPVMNPFGVPPPGMPYAERPSTMNEVDSDEHVEDSDEDIVMPEGPPPGANLEGTEGSSDDDIPMPEGPPPGTIPYLDHQLPSAVPPSFLPPPPYLPVNNPPFAVLPPPLPGFNSGIRSSPPGTTHPPPPPGFFPPRIQSAATIQDPLSYIPHQTYQAHRVTQPLPGHPSLPPKPQIGPSSSMAHAGAIISAEPELRNLKKEATAFVPASLKRKKAPGISSSAKVNAAPSVSAGPETMPPQARPDLVGIVKSQLGTATASSSSSQVSDSGPKVSIIKERDDYQKFVDEMSDLLGPPDNL